MAALFQKNNLTEFFDSISDISNLLCFPFFQFQLNVRLNSHYKGFLIGFVYRQNKLGRYAKINPYQEDL